MYAGVVARRKFDAFPCRAKIRPCLHVINEHSWEEWQLSQPITAAALPAIRMPLFEHITMHCSHALARHLLKPSPDLKGAYRSPTTQGLQGLGQRM
eukprot:300855-Pelagomonas_calceolata.AAC.1